jgi:hypothetical protein
LPKPALTVISGTLGRANSDDASTDVWDVECGRGTKTLTAFVKDLPTQPELITKVSLLITTDGKASNAVTDTIDTDNLYSSAVTFRTLRGEGHYQLNVFKPEVDNVMGSEFYEVGLYCLDAGGKKTETQFELMQDETQLDHNKNEHHHRSHENDRD